MSYVEIEVRAKSVDLAVEAAMNELGVDDKELVAIEVVTEPVKGFLGIGGQDAVVRVKRRKTAAAAQIVANHRPINVKRVQNPKDHPRIGSETHPNRLRMGRNEIHRGVQTSQTPGENMRRERKP